MIGSTLKLQSQWERQFEMLLQGLTPEQIVGNAHPTFWVDLFARDVNESWLSSLFARLSNDECLGQSRFAVSAIFEHACAFVHHAMPTQPQKKNGMQVLAIMLRTLLAKNFAGYEIMEVLAGGVAEADAIFSHFTAALQGTIGDSTCPDEYRLGGLHIALTFMCGVNQLSPGAYLLRTQLFPLVLALCRDVPTPACISEGMLFLTLLACYHKSDAATLNPYLRGIKDCREQDAMGLLCMALTSVCRDAVKAYQVVADDAPPTLIAQFGTLLSGLRPDRVLASTYVDTREQYKHLPIASAVVLFPTLEFLRANELFRETLRGQVGLEDVNSPLRALLSACSYLVTHGQSSPRGAAYAHLCLKTLAACVAHDGLFLAFTREPAYKTDIWLCRQRAPQLPLASAPRPPLCAVLDCCVLWLRHNMRKQLEVDSYITCIGVLHQSLQSLYIARIRFEYHWTELWTTLIALLDHLASRADSLRSIAGVDELTQLTIILLRSALLASESVLPSAGDVHQFVYELVRSSHVLEKHKSSQSLAARHPSASQKRAHALAIRASRCLAELEKVTSHYGQKIGASDPRSSARTADAVMASIRAEVDRDGIFTTSDTEESFLVDSDDLDISFVRWASQDGMALVSKD